MKIIGADGHTVENTINFTYELNDKEFPMNVNAEGGDLNGDGIIHSLDVVTMTYQYTCP